ncbi:MAG: hypothetical protein ACOZE5_14260 [Verrucomicrobiota bacterium]
MSTFRHSISALDQLVYQLYGLTDDEIKLVEQATAPTTSNIDSDQEAVSAPLP